MANRVYYNSRIRIPAPELDTRRVVRDPAPTKRPE